MIGRKNEIEKLQSAMLKDRAQLIAVYGRRRVGKTFLINEFFEGKFLFKHTAVSPVDDATKKRKKNMLKLQLQEFYYSMRTYGLDSSAHVPGSWQEAFYMLEQLLEKKDDGKRQVIFIDELPWMDTPSRTSCQPSNTSATIGALPVGISRWWYAAAQHPGFWTN